MLSINIRKPTNAQYNRSMRGCGMRIVEGDTPIMVKAELVRKIKNKFKNGKAHTLSPQEMEGSGIKEMYNTAKKAKKAVVKKANQVAKEVGREAREVGRELKKEAYKHGNIFIDDVARPYAAEIANAGILGLAGAASVVQPELAPFIAVGAIGASSVIENYINNIGKRQPNPIRPYEKPVEEDYGEQYIVPPQVPQLAQSQIHDMSAFQKQNNLIGYGFRGYTKYGSGMFSGGRLVTGKNELHPALLSPSPEFFISRNALPANIQNQLYYS
jgi:hypothetical protein